MIPVTASGEMDYDFMVLFVRAIIKRTIRGVVEWKNREISVEREGRVLLVQYRGESDPETGGAYTVKRYVSKDSDPGLGDDVMLKPINKDYKAMRISPTESSTMEPIAMFVRTLWGRCLISMLLERDISVFCWKFCTKGMVSRF